MMTRPDIEAIRMRVEAATAGPWYSDDAGGIATWPFEHGQRSNIVESDGQGYGVCTSEDAEFIASSIDDIPALLAYVAELEEIAAKVADVQPASHEDDTYYCIFCEQDESRQADDRWGIRHTEDCPVIIARQLLTNQASRTLD